MECPNCGLLNPAGAERCDCGYDFASRSMKESLLSLEELRRASEDPNPAYLPPFDIFLIFSFGSSNGCMNRLPARAGDEAS
jgi:hypothetical protein